MEATDRKYMDLQISKIWYPAQVRHRTLQATVPETPDKGTDGNHVKKHFQILKLVHYKNKMRNHMKVLRTGKVHKI